LTEACRIKNVQWTLLPKAVVVVNKRLCHNANKANLQPNLPAAQLASVKREPYEARMSAELTERMTTKTSEA
jgi:hypothetical protein